MASKSRKYKLTIGDQISYGIGVSGTTKEYNLLNDFTFVSGATTCNYPTITKNDLAILDTIDYKKRIRDLLYTINLEDREVINNLINNAETTDDECVLCKLNDDFLVYSFFDGVRVIDVGEAIGVLEYKAFPSDDDPNNYSWQTSPTFLGLDNTKVYIFQVRDYLDGEVRCMIEKTISLNFLVPSTIIPPEPKEVYITVGTDVSYENGKFNSGNIIVNPNLINEQSVSLNYTISSVGENGGIACVIVCCKPNGSNITQQINSVCESITSPVTGNVVISEGDIVSYSINTESENLGSLGTASLTLDSVNGLGSTLPVIDLARNSVEIISETPPFDTVVNLTGDSSGTLGYNCLRRGHIYLVPDVPDTYSVLTNVTSNISTKNNGAGSARIRCKPNGATIFSELFYNTQNLPQPQSINIRLRRGDEILYDLTGEFDVNTPDSCGCASLELVTTDGDTGINATISDINFRDSVSNNNTPKPVSVAVCQQNVNSSSTYDCCVDGFININPILEGAESVHVDLNLVATVSDTASFASTRLYCKSYGTSSFVRIPGLEYISQPEGTVNSETIKFRTGDQVCYEICSDSFTDWNTGKTCVEITNVTGFGGVVPTINSSKSSDSTISAREGVPTNIIAGITRQTVSSPAVKKIGELTLNPAIPTTPSGNYVDVRFISRVSTCLGGYGCVRLACKPAGSTSISEILQNTNSTSKAITVRVNRGDVISYITYAECDNKVLNSCACASLAMTSITASPAIEPFIDTNNRLVSSISEKKLRNITVSLNVISDASSATCQSSCGLVNLSKVLNSTDQITVNYTVKNDAEVAAVSMVQLFCKPFGSTIFTDFDTIDTSTDGSITCSNSFIIKVGDEICYRLYSEQFNVPGSQASASFELDSVSGSLAVNPSIDNSNCCDETSVAYVGT